MGLLDWHKNGWLRAHKTSADEIAALFAVVERDLADSEKSISDDWRFGIAYNAMLQAAMTALAAAGYQPEKGGQHHFRAIQSLSETIGADKKTIGLLEAYRRKRNIVEYERSGTVSEADVTTMRDLATSIRDGVRAWIAEKHRALLPEQRRK